MGYRKRMTMVVELFWVTLTTTKKRYCRTYNQPLLNSLVVETIYRTTYSSSSRLIRAIAVPVVPDIGVLYHSGQHSTAHMDRCTHLTSEYRVPIILYNSIC